MARPTHSVTEIEAAIQRAEAAGWTVKLSRGALWGRIYSPQHARDGCRVSVWSTPRAPGAHARDIMRIIGRGNDRGD